MTLERLRGALARITTAGLTLRQAQVLLACASAGVVTSGGLAQQLGLHHASVVPLVDVLVLKGLVARDAAPADRRLRPLRLTDRGQALIATLLAEGEQPGGQRM